MENVAKQKIKLGLVQRLELLNLFPAKSSVVKMIVYRDLKSKIDINQDEIKKFNIRDEIKDEKLITLFNVKNKEDEIEFEFTDVEILHLKELLNEASKKEKISINLLMICLELQIK